MPAPSSHHAGLDDLGLVEVVLRIDSELARHMELDTETDEGVGIAAARTAEAADTLLEQQEVGRTLQAGPEAVHTHSEEEVHHRHSVQAGRTLAEQAAAVPIAAAVAGELLHS